MVELHLKSCPIVYNMIEYSENYSETSERLWQFKKDETTATAAGNPKNVSTANSTPLKYRGCCEWSI